MKKSFEKIAIRTFVFLFVFESALNAAYLDAYISNNEPQDPVYNIGWSWPEGWTNLSSTDSIFLLEPDSSLWIGLQNIQIEELNKTVTLTYNSGGVVPVSTKAGYEDGSTKAWDIKLIESTTTSRKWQGTIQQQPGWEWIQLKNPLSSAQPLRIRSFTSTCSIPEPDILALLTISGLALVLIFKKYRKLLNI